MQRRYLIIGSFVLIAALAGLAVLGSRVLDRDRREIHREYADDKMHRLEAAAIELGNDVEKIGEDLELAAALAAAAGSPDVRERELHAIATITREYLALEIQDATGATLVAVMEPPTMRAVIDRSRVTIDETIAGARAEPGVFKTSRPLGEGDDDATWYRVFARQSPGSAGLVVAIVVDMRPLLDRLRLLDDSASSLLVLGAHGLPAPSSDEILAQAARSLDRGRADLPALAHLLDEVRARRTATVLIDEDEAVRLGLPAAVGVGVAVPVLIEDGEPWALALVSTTAALRAQERTLVRRMIVGSGLIAALLIALSVYFVWNARRAAALHERVRQADRFAHAEKLATAGQLAAGIAHEIGTPLNVVRGRAELTLARLGDGHPQAASQQVIVQQIDHVSRLISQLLDYVRPHAPVAQLVDIEPAIRSTMELLAPEAAKRKVRLGSEIADALPPLRIDAGQLQQVLVNLTMNALDACNHDGVVTVRAHVRGGERRALLLDVEDNGVGVPEPSRVQIFDPFYTTKKRGQGTGLGLWVVAQLVRSHGADIELHSIPTGGTRFRVTWPLPDPGPGRDR